MGQIQTSQQEAFFGHAFDAVECAVTSEDSDTDCEPYMFKMMDVLSAGLDADCKQKYQAYKEMDDAAREAFEAPECEQQVAKMLDADGFLASCYIAMGKKIREKPDSIMWKDKELMGGHCNLLKLEFASEI